MVWEDIIKRDYDSVITEVQHLESILNAKNKQVEKLRNELSVFKRGKTYSMLSEEEKKKFEKLFSEAKRLEREIKEESSEYRMIIRQLDDFGSTDFIDDNM